ncbi:hybrid sensor histidine kinase/response regulator transcription factor [Carboxylicivirga sp. M1479]|uniref:hybrid sensor histidine kinase/response regulator transcription factor n=1 Tax=Carboxylicivirga sp. M1479 TaxID=2594476 RepID=UPI0011780D52|nr:hybrid sensor histidine kinase/response regulator transcription factor [Carboxylicivirga sp. M1479]TRX70201.1 response regulator [Carboxylicivirga sp. M1479]
MKKLLLYIIVLFFLFSKVTGNTKNLSLQDGISGSRIYSIIEDKNGIIYLSTNNGIDRYNGSDFEHYKFYDDRYSQTVFGRCMHYNKNKHVLWIGTQAGLYEFDFESDKIIRVKCESQELQKLNIRTIRTDNNGRLWLGARRGLFIKNNDTIIKVSEISREINSIDFINNKTAVVGTSRGCYKVNTETLMVSFLNLLTDTTNDFRNEHFTLVRKDKQNRLWLCSVENGLAVYDITKGSMIELPKATQQLIPKGTTIKQIINHSNNNVLIATDGTGVYELNDQLMLQQHLRHDEDDPSTIGSNAIYNMLIDSNYRLWLTSYGGGISIIDPNRITIGHLSHQYNEKKSLGNNYVREIIEDEQQRLWFGTRKGISIYNKSTKKWNHIYNKSLKNKNLGSNTILSMCQIAPNEVWVSSYGGGINVINTKTLEVSALYNRKALLRTIGSPHIFSIHRDSHDDIWLAVANEPLCKYDRKRKTIKKYPVKDVKSIYEMNEGLLILGSNNTFGTFNIGSGQYKSYTIDKEDDVRNVYTIINCFHKINEQEVFIGTSDGLKIFNVETKAIEHFGSHMGFISNDIRSILKDKDGVFWIGTTNGISQLNIINDEITNFIAPDEVKLTEALPGASLYSKNDTMYFGGINGATYFSKDEFRKSIIPPNLHFSNFRILNKLIRPAVSGSVLTKHINMTDTVTLKANQNSFAVSFYGLNYTNPHKNRYTWKLDGFQEEWGESTQITTANYTNIPPGEYVLKIKSTNIPNTWNGTERNLHIIIEPPIWLTPWAYLLYSIMVILLMYGILRLNKVRYMQKHSKEKIDFFVQFAHDLRTSLTLITSPLSIISENNNLEKRDREMLELSRSNLQKLTARFNQLLDFQKADINKLQPHIEKHNLIDHLNETIENFRPAINNKELTLKLENFDNEILVYYDRNKLDKALLNLLSNAIKYTPEKGSLTVRCFLDKKHWHITITDTGIGIPKVQQRYIFNEYYRGSNAINSTENGSGVGLLLVKKIVELHKGKITFKSVENIGTSFTIQIPYALEKQATETSQIESSNTSILPVTTLHEENAPSQAGKSGKQIKILIVEDNKELRSYLIEAFNNEYITYDASNGKEALEIIKKQHPALIISDVMMPVMDGTTLTQKIKSDLETCHIPVILLTALTDTTFKKAGYKIGADDYIEKPFDISLLKVRVENLITGRDRLKNKFTSFVEFKESEVTYENKLDNDFIKKAIQFVNDNMINEKLSVVELSKELCVSRPVLYRKIKALTDQSPQEFINLLKLKKAADILKSQQLSISETAFLTGFANPKHFSTNFKKQFGMSPSQFIKRDK